MKSQHLLIIVGVVLAIGYLYYKHNGGKMPTVGGYTL